MIVMVLMMMMMMTGGGGGHGDDDNRVRYSNTDDDADDCGVGTSTVGGTNGQRQRRAGHDGGGAGLHDRVRR